VDITRKKADKPGKRQSKPGKRQSSLTPPKPWEAFIHAGLRPVLARAREKTRKNKKKNG
jgi:hypothetical protein